MQQEIHFNGYSATPSDYDNADGQLALSLGAINEDAALRPILPPKVKFTIKIKIQQKGQDENGNYVMQDVIIDLEDATVLYVHETSVVHNYIISHKKDDGSCSLYYSTDGIIENTAFASFGKEQSLLQVNSVGNTLVILASDGMHFFIWRDNAYTYLGQKPPEFPMTFSLSGNTEVLVKETGSKTGQSLWMISKADGDTAWSGPVRVSGEVPDVHSGEWKTYVFRNVKFGTHYNLIQKPSKPSTNDPSPANWLDVPSNNKDYWFMCIGTVNGAAISWSDVYSLFPGYPTLPGNSYDAVKFRFYASNDADNPPACDTAAADPTGWTVRPVAVNTNEETLFTVKLEDGISESDYSYLSSGAIGHISLSDADKIAASSGVMASVALWVAQANDDNKFVFPFFVRYAYKLFDGSYIMQSAPILMVPNSLGQPLALINRLTGKEQTFKKPYYQVFGPQVNLEIHSIPGQDTLDALALWKDIVVGIDVFISQQFYNYSTDGQIEQIYSTANDEFANAFSISRLDTASNFNNMYDYQRFNLLGKYALFGSGAMTVDENDNFLVGGLAFRLPQLADEKEEYFSRIENCSSFFLLKAFSLDPDDDNFISSGIVEVEDGYLKSIATKPTLGDDYQSHDLIIPQRSFAYNSRLNVANIERVLFDGFPVDTMSPHNVIRYESGMSQYYIYSAFVFIHTDDGKDIVVQCPNALTGLYAIGDFFFYPNPRAFKAVVCYNSGWGGMSYAELKLKEHPTLNGAYWFSRFSYPGFSVWASGKEPAVTANKSVLYRNKIYASEVNNPFYFPLTGIVTVGIGSILGISSAARPLSQGQFGQFPLYAFTTEGVWALTVNSDGTYSASQPITRDVCLSPDSIAQLDSSVLFATDRGIMEISGSQTACISDILNYPDLFQLSDLPKPEGLLKIYNSRRTTDDAQLSELEIIPFADFLQGCRMLYDYPHQHIIVFNPAVAYAYVFSLRSKLWGMMRSRLASPVNSYPEALAMTTDNELVDFSQSDAQAVTSLIVTRPFTLGAPDVLKTINTVIQRGRFARGHVAQILYGSRDLVHWFTVWSSVDQYLRGFRGSPYKAFRLALFARLDRQESLSGCTVQFEPRMTNQPR